MQRSLRLRARATHRCVGCQELIRPGHTYVRHSVLYDGSWSTYKQCLRCDAIAEAILTNASPGTTIAFELDCGSTWKDAFEADPPEALQALAFWLPGEPLPSDSV
jgi:hypothetical protein